MKYTNDENELKPVGKKKLKIIKGFGLFVDLEFCF